IHWSATCCICSGERPLYQSVPRKISKHPLGEGVLMIPFLPFVGCWCLRVGWLNRWLDDTTNGPTTKRHLDKGTLFCLRIHFPKGERVGLRILADGEITHPRNRCLWFANAASQFFHFRHEGGDGRHADIAGDGVGGMHPFHQTTVG